MIVDILFAMSMKEVLLSAGKLRKILKKNKEERITEIVEED